MLPQFLFFFVNVLVINVGSEGPYSIDFLTVLENSIHHPQSTPICPGILISHLGIIKTYGNIEYINKPRKTKHRLNSLPYIGAV